MALEGSLKNRDGGLYVLYTADEDNEPVRQLIWYRVLETRGTGYGDRPEAGDLATRASGGEWRTRNPTTQRSTGSVTGSTQPELVERVNIPPPAAGGKTLRWHQGRWERLLARGWVPTGEGKAGGGRKSAAHATRAPHAAQKTPRQLDNEIAEALHAKKWQEQIAREDLERRLRLAHRASAPTPEQLLEEYQADLAAGIFHGEPRGRARTFRRDRSTRQPLKKRRHQFK